MKPKSWTFNSNERVRLHATPNHQSNQNDAGDEEKVRRKRKEKTNVKGFMDKIHGKTCQAKEIQQKWHTINVFCIIFGLPKNLFVEIPCWFVYLQVAFQPDQKPKWANRRKKSRERERKKRINRTYKVCGVVASILQSWIQHKSWMWVWARCMYVCMREGSRTK